MAHAHSHSSKKHKKLWLLLAAAVAVGLVVTLLVLWLNRPAVPVSTQGALDGTTPFTCTVNLHTGDFDATGTLERTQPGEYRFTLSQPQELEGLVAQYGEEGLKLSFHGLEFSPEVETLNPGRGHPYRHHQRCGVYRQAGRRRGIDGIYPGGL